MEAPPRRPQAPLLDKLALRFIFIAGSIMTLLGCALLVGLPRLGTRVEVTRTAVFLYITICQLTFAYPARRVGASPRPNLALRLSVVLGIALQLLIVFVPWLRELLGLALPDMASLLCVGLATLLGWGVAEISARLDYAEDS